MTNKHKHNGNGILAKLDYDSDFAQEQYMQSALYPKEGAFRVSYYVFHAKYKKAELIAASFCPYAANAAQA